MEIGPARCPALPLRRSGDGGQRLTPTSWEPVSKQPHFKSGAARIVRASWWIAIHLSSYLGLLETGSATLAKSYCQVADGHAEEADVKQIWSSSRLSVIIMRSDWSRLRPAMALIRLGSRNACTPMALRDAQWRSGPAAWSSWSLPACWLSGHGLETCRPGR